MMAEGKKVAAAELLTLCDMAEAGARLRPGLIATATWENVKADFLLISTSEYASMVPWDVKLAVTGKLIAENRAAKSWKSWALRVWPAAAAAGDARGEGEEQWCLENARLSALLMDMFASGAEAEDIEALAAMVENELCGDTLFAFVQNVDVGDAGVKSFREWLRVVVDLAASAPNTEAIEKAIPKFPACVQALKGLRGLVDPVPLMFSKCTADDIEFLLPFGGGKAFGNIFKSGLRAGGPLARHLKASSTWKNLHGEFVRHMGSAERLGEDLVALCEQLLSLKKTIEKQVGADNVEEETEQENAMAELDRLSKDFAAKKQEYEEQVRPGGLQPVLDALRAALEAEHKQVIAEPAPSVERLEALRDGANVCGASDLHQAVNDSLLAVVASSAVQSVREALRSGCSTVAGAQGLLGAWGPAGNEGLPEDIIKELATCIPVLYMMLRKQGASADISDVAVIQPALDLLRKLCADKVIVQADSSMLAGDTNMHSLNAKMFSNLLHAVVSFRKCVKQAEAPGARRAEQLNLASATTAVLSMIRQPPKWTGAAMEEGETLLRDVDEAVTKAQAVLNTYGQEELRASLAKVVECTRSLMEVAGGRKDGRPWTEGLANNAASAAILKHFDASIGKLKDEDINQIDQRMRDLQKAYDDCKQSRSSFSVYVKVANLDKEVGAGLASADEAFRRREATEYGNWILRILLGAGGTKARNPEKAISAKHLKYVNSPYKNNPAKHLHPAIWAVAKPKIAG